MMYDSKMAVAIKVGGKILRERNETAFIPFGQEYTILIKNMNSVRALVSIHVDGQEATEGTRLVIQPNSSLDLERFIKNGNFNQGNRFKFIERTASIENGPRGIKVDDGLIRIEFEFEREPSKMVNTYMNNIRSYDQPSFNDQGFNDRSLLRSRALHSGMVGSVGSINAHNMGIANPRSVTGEAEIKTSASFCDVSMAACSASAANLSYDGDASFKGILPKAPQSDVGITVAGSVSSQQFRLVSAFPTDGVKHVMILKLAGELEGVTVEKPVTVEYKPTCITCGRVNKATSKFCTECGTSLNLV